MSKIVYQHNEVLFPRLDKDYMTVAEEMTIDVMQGWPDRKAYLRFRVEVKESPDKKTADLKIIVIDPTKFGWDSLQRFLFWVSLFMLIYVLLF